jgi:hypothetical protein
MQGEVKTLWFSALIADVIFNLLPGRLLVVRGGGDSPSPGYF